MPQCPALRGADASSGRWLGPHPTDDRQPFIAHEEQIPHVALTLQDPDGATDEQTDGEMRRKAAPHPRMRSSLAWLVALGTYLPLAALGYLPVWVHWSQQLNGCNCWDQLLLEWFVNWTPPALAPGPPVLVTNFIDGPGGVNLMWNTSVLALGTLASPLTETIGVVHTFAILLTLSVALSASTI